MRSEPVQTYGPPSRLPGRPAQVVSPMPDAGRSSGLRALRLSPPSYVHRFPAPKSQCVSWIRSRLPLRGSPGVAPGSLLLSEILREPAWAAVYCGLRYLSTEILRSGNYSVHQRDVADEARKYPPIRLPDVHYPGFRRHD
jgi:hypothetical protein